MARRVMRGRRPGGGLRQRTAWSRIIGTTTTIPAASKVIVGAFVTLIDELTIRRTLVSVRVTSDQATQEVQSGAFGMYVASDAAVAVGASALLGPVTDLEDEVWFVWKPFLQEQVGEGSSITSKGELYEVDSRGQRKLFEGQQAVLMVENSDAVTGLQVQIAVSLLAGFGLQR